MKMTLYGSLVRVKLLQLHPAEKKEGLNDRDNPIMRPKMQAGFIHALYLPLYRTLDKVNGLNLEECVSQLEANLLEWYKQIDPMSPRL